MKFNPSSDIPPLTDKVILITGGTDGLGKACIHQLIQHSPSHIYMTARSRTKASSMLRELAEQYPDGHAPVTVLEMDLASLSSVKAGAEKFLAMGGTSPPRLDLLMCNAGVMGSPALTRDGYEMAFGVNHLGHALLIQLLLPTLRTTAEREGEESDVRVVCLSSLAESWAPKHYTFDKMRTELPQLGKMARYGQSKLANVQYAGVLAKRYPEITFVSVHPGTVRTNIAATFYDGMNKGLAWVMGKVLPLFFEVVEPDEGAKGQLWCLVGKKEEIVNGEFYWPVGVRGKGSRRVKDWKMAEGLWEWTEEQLKPYY